MQPPNQHSFPLIARIGILAILALICLLLVGTKSIFSQPELGLELAQRLCAEGKAKWIDVREPNEMGQR